MSFSRLSHDMKSNLLFFQSRSAANPFFLGSYICQKLKTFCLLISGENKATNLAFFPKLTKLGAVILCFNTSIFRYSAKVISLLSLLATLLLFLKWVCSKNSRTTTRCQTKNLASDSAPQNLYDLA